tara:strand:+ start:2582 stop:4030 length:1449 start_codon:yes stop_codon:yes gene_type:complete
MATNSIIEQKPPSQIWQILPVGQEIIFVVSNNTAVANETNVKFVAKVHISNSTYPDLSTTTDLIGTFKTTPNNAGVGIYNFRNIIENYVSADNMAANGSSYKGTTTSATARHPLHLIDKYSLNDDIVRYMAIEFSVEYKGATDTSGNSDVNTVKIQAGTERNSRVYVLFNGYVKETDVLTMGTGVGANDFGFDMSPFVLSGASSTKKLLTNMPTNQYANIDDYGTMSFWDDAGDPLYRFTLVYYDSEDSLLGTDYILRSTANGAYDTYDVDSKKQIVHFGCFPGNLNNWASTFRTLVAAGTIQGGYYFVTAVDLSSDAMTQTYRINLNCPTLKGYEPIRLAWLNQWGCWDYYTFIKQSTKTISTKGTTYDQLDGTWNDSYYRIDSFKGGKKTFRVNATEKIKINTDFVSEDYNIIFEELINSPEVYVLEGYQTDATNTALNQYVKPVRLATSSFTRKTVANDKLIQYAFEIEKSKKLRTQSV